MTLEFEIARMTVTPLFKEVHTKTADEIMSYLLRHPKSKDTLEGIAEWWLEMHYIDQGIELVSKALSHLCSKGIVSKKSNVDGNNYYELNLRHDDEKQSYRIDYLA